MAKEIICKITDETYNRPSITKPCGKKIAIDINSIAINILKTGEIKFFQLCPECGFMVDISQNDLTKDEIKFISENNKLHPNMYVDMHFESQELALNKSKIK